MYKYRTRIESPKSVMVLRTLKCNPEWPRDELDMETLEVECTNRREAIRIARATELHCWG